MTRTALSSPHIPLSRIPATGVDFSGSTSAIITVSDTANLRVELKNKWSWSLWIYPYNTNNNDLPFLVQKGADYICFMGDQTNSRKNKFALEVVNNSDSVQTELWGNTNIVPYTWQHLVCTFNDGTCMQYINTVADTPNVIAGPYVSPIAPTTGSPLAIGNRSASLLRNFSGIIANVRMFQNKILSQAEVTQMFSTDDVTSGLVGKWNLDEGTGTTANDTSGNGYHGTLSSASWATVSRTRSTASTRSSLASSRLPVA